MSRSELVFRAVEAVSNRYDLVNRAAHLSKQLRHVYRDTIPGSLNSALSKIGHVEAPEPLPAPKWRDMLARKVAREVIAAA